jgi:hypothetical protein
MWRLPSGKTIKNPDRSKTFEIGGITYPESNLLQWDDAQLTLLGIYRVVEIGYDSDLYTLTGYTEATSGIVITRTPTLIDRADRVEVRATRMTNALTAEVKIYLENHYDSISLSTFNMVMHAASPPPAIEAAVRSVYAWFKSVLQYYKTTGSAIQAATDIPTLEAITWDFLQFDATDPNVDYTSFL